MHNQYSLTVDLARAIRNALTDEMIDAERANLFHPSNHARDDYAAAMAAWAEADDRLVKAKAALWRYEHGVIGPWSPRATIGASDFEAAREVEAV